MEMQPCSGFHRELILCHGAAATAAEKFANKFNVTFFVPAREESDSLSHFTALGGCPGWQGIMEIRREGKEIWLLKIQSLYESFLLMGRV